MTAIRIADKAKEDLRSIWNYTHDTWSEKQADKYLKELMNEFSTIVKYPQRGRNYHEISSEYFGIKKNKHIRFYRISQVGDVEIIRILHELMDLPNRMKE